MKTSFPKPGKPAWYVVDAADQSLGRLASKVSMVIRGRHRASYVPQWLSGDHVIVLNADKMRVEPKKMEQKMYYRHTGFFGGLKEASLKQLMEKHPTKAFMLAVKGMLPKNQSREHILKHLHVCAGTEHDYAAQKPQPLSL